MFIQNFTRVYLRRSYICSCLAGQTLLFITDNDCCTHLCTLQMPFTFDVVFKTHKFPLMFNYSTALSFPSCDLSEMHYLSVYM